MTVSSSKLEQNVRFVISDQAHTLNLNFSGYLKFSHITDKVRIFFLKSSSCQLSLTESFNLNLSEMALIFELKSVLSRRPSAFHTFCLYFRFRANIRGHTNAHGPYALPQCLCPFKYANKSVLKQTWYLELDLLLCGAIVT